MIFALMMMSEPGGELSVRGGDSSGSYSKWILGALPDYITGPGSPGLSGGAAQSRSGS